MAKFPKFDQAKQDAARAAAKQLREAGFVHVSSGWEFATVIHDGGRRTTMVEPAEVNKFIATAAL